MSASDSPTPDPTQPLPEGEAKATAVRSMFDAIAPRYDLLNRTMTFRLDVRWRRRTVRRLALPAGAIFIAAAKRPQECRHCEKKVTEQDGTLVDRNGNPECPDNPDGTGHETTPRGQQPATAESTSGGRAGEI